MDDTQFYPAAYEHLLYLAVNQLMLTCDQCGSLTPENAVFCPFCGTHLELSRERRLGRVEVLSNKAIANTELQRIRERQRKMVFPGNGVYIYFHPYEGYKIGKAENVFRRMAKHLCSAPSSQLLHVIESSDVGWAERWVQDKYKHRRRRENHEYFDLTIDDLVWLFSIKVLEPPRSEAAQLNLLDLL